MNNSTTATTVSIVTPEQVALCERVIDMASGQAFYVVKSESYADNNQEYTVKAMPVNGRYFLTCTCQAGMSGTPCKHKRWATAAAQIEKTQVKVEAMSKAPVTVATDVDNATLKRVTRASLANKQAPASVVEQDAKHYASKAFSLMR